MYDREDVGILTERFYDSINYRSNLKENNFNSSISTSSKLNARKMSRDETRKK